MALITSAGRFNIRTSDSSRSSHMSAASSELEVSSPVLVATIDRILLIKKNFLCPYRSSYIASGLPAINLVNQPVFSVHARKVGGVNARSVTS